MDVFRVCSSANAVNTEANEDLTGARETHVPGDLRLREAAAGCIVAYIVAFVSQSNGAVRLLRQLTRRRYCDPDS